MHAQTCDKKDVVRELQMIKMLDSKPVFLDSVLFSSIFLAFSIITSNHMSSQEALHLRHPPLHHNDIRYQNNMVYH